MKPVLASLHGVLRACLSAGLVAALCSLPTDGAFAQGTSPAPKDKREREAPPRPGDKSGPPGGQQGGPQARKPAIRIPGASIPTDPAVRARLLRDLYALLATAQDQQSAEATTSAIERVWQAGIGDTARVLIERAGKVASEERPDLALRLLDTVTRIAPDQPEGFYRRAFIYYSLNEFGRAVADLRQVLALDPSHYKALEGLGQILRESNQKKAALDVYRRLQAVHPFSSGTKSALEDLERSVVGQET